MSSNTNLTMAFGFTITTPDYSPAFEGFREGAHQVIEFFTPEYDPSEVVDVKRWAEAAFTATNAPLAVVEDEPKSAAIYRDIIENADGTIYRSLSVGDTVAVLIDGVWVRTACERFGWSEPRPIKAIVGEGTGAVA